MAARHTPPPGEVEKAPSPHTPPPEGTERPLPSPELSFHYRSCTLRNRSCAQCVKFVETLEMHARWCSGSCRLLACLHMKARMCGAERIGTPTSLDCVRTLLDMADTQ